jgi:hypothetical protein
MLFANGLPHVFDALQRVLEAGGQVVEVWKPAASGASADELPPYI